MMGNNNHIYHILIGNNQYLYPIPIGNNFHYLSSIWNITSSFRCPQNLLPISSTKSQAGERLLQMIELAKEWFLGDRIVHNDMCRRSWLVGDYRTYTTLYYPILVGGDWNHGILWLSIQLGMSSSQLTKSYFSRWLKPPTSRHPKEGLHHETCEDEHPKWQWSSQNEEKKLRRNGGVSIKDVGFVIRHGGLATKHRDSTISSNSGI